MAAIIPPDLAKTPAHQLDTLRRYVRWEGFHAIEMLSIWIAAEALEPDLVRLDPKLLDRDSAFVAFKRETHSWLIAHLQHQAFDDSHLQVMLQQCRDKVEKLRKLGTGSGAGASMDVAHLLERLDQTFNRIVLLLTTFENEKPKLNNLLTLTGTLACATAEQQSVSRLWKRSVGMLARSITQNTSDHGEHYITRSKKEYMGMVRSAAGGGVLIALMALFKIVYVGRHITNPFAYGVAAGLNYGLGFALIFVLHFTVATKQPAMTASRFAAAVERSESGHAVNQKLAQLLIDVVRSQVAAVAGNVVVALTLAMLIALVYRFTQGVPILTEAEVAYQIHSVNPWGATLWYRRHCRLVAVLLGHYFGLFGQPLRLPQPADAPAPTPRAQTFAARKAARQSRRLSPLQLRQPDGERVLRDAAGHDGLCGARAGAAAGYSPRCLLLCQHWLRRSGGA